VYRAKLRGKEEFPERAHLASFHITGDPALLRLVTGRNYVYQGE
jgi:hypothetical protein